MARCAGLEIIPAGRAFRRPGGREGHWLLDSPHRYPDDLVTCPFDFVKVPGQQAEAALDELKRDRPDTTPILLGSPHEAGLLFERMAIWPASADEWLAAAQTFQLDRWLAERQAELDAYCEKSGETIPRRGLWPETVPSFTRLRVPDEILKPGPKPIVIIGLLPTADPTETAAYLHFGGWNQCPKPPVHIALARRWRDRYGAVQVSNTHDAVEFRVAQPLTDREDALALALVQYHYCSDSIPETLEVAAAELIGAMVWHFWWD
jgi:Domain of unknown function (DUF4253)